MKEIMNEEVTEMIRVLEKANNALSRVFNVEEDDSTSWGELAELTHATQVEKFGWCACEDSQAPYTDCPKEGEEE